MTRFRSLQENSLQADVSAPDQAIRFPPGLGAAIGLVFIIPFLVYYRPAPIGDFHTEWLACVLFAFVIIAAFSVLGKKFHVLAGLLLLPFTLAVVLGIHIALGRYAYAYDWFMWLAYLGMFSATLILGQGLRATGLVAEVTNRMAWAIVLTALLLLITQIAQIYQMEPLLAPFVVTLMTRSVCRIHGNIGQANQATTMAWFGIAAALYLLQERRLGRVLGIVVVAALLISSALTASRMAWLFAIVVAAAMVWFTPGQGRPVGRRLVLAGALLIGFAVADQFAVRMIHLLNDSCPSGIERVAGESGAFSIRRELWRQALLVWHENPWLGGGAGSFMGQVYKLEAPGLHQPFDYYAHNSLLQLLAEFGIVGAAAGAGTLMWGAYRLFRARAEVDSHSLLLLCWVTIVLIYSMLEYPLWYMHFLILFGLALGLLMKPSWGRAIVSIRSMPVLGGATLLIVLGCAYAAYEYRKVERAFYLVVDSQASGSFGSRELNQTLNQIDAESHLYRLHLDYVLGIRVPITREGLDQKLAENERLMNKIPLAATVTRHVLLLTLAGDLSGARWHLQRMLQFDPPETDIAVRELRRFAKERPDDFGALGPMVDEEIARAPKRRW